MKSSAFKFSGEGALNYDKYLGPLLFEPYAKHVAATSDFSGVNEMLELACGTGRLTNCIASVLPPSAKYIATDINADMLEIGKQKLKNTSIDFQIADAHLLPFKNNSFDLVVCQFGLMFFTDLNQALHEIFRVLKPGGKFLFSTWDKTAHSPLLKLVFDDILLPYYENEDRVRLFQPFSLHEKEKLDLHLSNAGFENISIKNLLLPAGNVPVVDVVNGFFLKHSLKEQIQNRDPDAVPFIASEMESRITQQSKVNSYFFVLSALSGCGEKSGSFHNK